MSIERRIIKGNGNLEYVWDVVAPSGCIVRQVTWQTSDTRDLFISVASASSEFTGKLDIEQLPPRGGLGSPIYCTQDDVLHFDSPVTSEWVLRIVVEKI